jgi:DNA-binding transcriptional ArsR family regulator
MRRLSEARLDELLRALAHPDRRRFLRACRREPVSAGDLAETSALALASVSEHLKVLRKTGLLVLEKQGRFRLYRADLTMLRRVIEALNKLEDTHGA